MGIVIAAIFVVSALLIGPANLLARGRWVAAALGYGVVVFLVRVLPCALSSGDNRSK
jgi:hypothetical protein